MAIVALPDGRVLFIGGGFHDMSDARPDVDVYDPTTGTLAPFATMKVGRILPGAAALADGRVVVVDGMPDGSQTAYTIEVYEPATKAFRLLPSHPNVGVLSPFAIPMKDGRVLIGGGMDMPMGGATYPRRAFILDPTTGTVTPAHDPPFPYDAKHFFFYSVATNGAITVTGSGPPGDLGWPTSDCEVTFDPQSGAWTDTKRCQPGPNVLRFPSTGGTPGLVGLDAGLKAFRNGAWETVVKAQPNATGASFEDALTLDAHHVIGADLDTYEVTRCTF